MIESFLQWQFSESVIINVVSIIISTLIGWGISQYYNKINDWTDLLDLMYSDDLEGYSLLGTIEVNGRGHYRNTVTVCPKGKERAVAMGMNENVFQKRYYSKKNPKIIKFKDLKRSDYE